MRNNQINISVFIIVVIILGTHKVSCQDLIDSSTIKHRFAVVDIRRNKAMIISEDNEVEWQYDVNTPTDIQVLKNGNILVAGIEDVFELNFEGDVIWSFSGSGDLFSADALKNGNYLIGCSAEFKLLELNKNHKEKRTIYTTTNNKDGHMHSRHVRKFKDGAYWVTLCADGLVNSYSRKGEILRSISVRKLSEEYGIQNTKKQLAYSVEELSNGHILISAGFPAFVAEIDKNGKLVWGLSAKDVPTANFIFSGGTKRLSNGNTLICNWTGHNYPNDYIPVFEVNREKEIVWSFNDKQKLPEPLGIYLLE